MSNEPIPLSAPDISNFVRSISQQLKNHENQPSHLTLMNIVARAAGFRNYQRQQTSSSKGYDYA